MTEEQEQEWRKEAEVLELLTDATIDTLVASFKIVANDQKRSKLERERARFLFRLLEARERKATRRKRRDVS